MSAVNPVGSVSGRDWAPLTVGELIPRLPEPDDPVALLEIALLAAWWPDALAGSGALPGCVLREHAGMTKRANSLLVPTRRVPADLSPAAGFYARRRLPALAMVRADAPAAPSLAPTPDPRVLVMTAPVEVVAAPVPRRGGGAGRPGVEVALDEDPSHDLIARTAGRARPGTSGEEARLLARRLLTSAPAQRFTSTPAGGAGRLAVTGIDGVAVLDGLFVPPRARRRGEASAMARALAGAAGALGARTMALEVERDNAPAVACYLALGFRTHHEHLYCAVLGAPA